MKNMQIKKFPRSSLESAAIAETRFNCLCLYRDAKRHFKAKRWGSCISFSILACEEFGKFMILVTSIGEEFYTNKKLRIHVKKQAVFSQHLRSCLRVKALNDYLIEKGYKNKTERGLEALKYYEKCSILLGRDGTQKSILADPEIGPIYKEIQQRIVKDKSYDIAARAAMGALDKIKQRGFYVDISPNAVYSPRQFSKKDATPYLHAAAIVVDSITLKNSPRRKPVQLTHVRL